MSRRRTAIAAVLVLCVGLSLFLAWRALPRIARWAVTRQIEAATGRPLTIGRFDLDLGRGRLVAGDVRLADRRAGPALVELDRLEARFEPLSVFGRELRIDEVTFAGVRMHVARDERGALNIADLLERPPAGTPAAVRVGRLTLSGGTVVLEDRAVAPARTWRVEGLAIDGAGLSTSAPDGTLQLAATAGGAPVSVELTRLRLAPFSAQAHVDAQGVDVTFARLFVPADAPVVLDRARVTTRLAAAMDGSTSARIEGQGRIDDIALVRRGSRAVVVGAPSLAFSLDALRNDDGVRVRRIEVTGAATVFDQRVNPPRQLPIDRVRLLVDGAAGGPTARLTLTAGLPGGGELDVTGEARFASLTGDLRAKVKRLDLAVWDAILVLPGRLDGLAEADIEVTVSPAPHAISARARGRAAVTRFALADGDRPVLSVPQIDVSGIDVEWPRVAVKRVSVLGPSAAVERDREGRLSAAALWRETGPAMPAPGAPGSARVQAVPGLDVQIGEISVSDGTVSVDDASVSPPARLRVSGVTASVTEVVWPARRPARVQVKASLPGAGTLDADGTMSIDPPSVELRVRLGGVALAPYSAYAPVAARVEGRLDVEVVVSGALSPRLDASVKGRAAVSDVVASHAGRPLLTVARIETTGLDYRWPATIGVDKLRVDRSWALLERRRDGSVVFRELFRPPVGRPDGSGPGPPGAAGLGPLDVRVRESVLEGGSLTIADGAVSPAARFEIAGARLEAGEFTWPIRQPVSLRASTSMPGGGTASIDGRVTANAGATADLKLVLSGVDVRVAQPYVPISGRIAGTASAELEIQATVEPLTISARGKAGVADLSLADADRPLVTAARVEASGVQYTWPAKVGVERLELDRWSAIVERRPDGTLPIRAIVSPLPRAPAPGQPSGAVSTPAAVSTPPVEAEIKQTVVSSGSVTIVDGTVTPATRVELTDVRLGLRDLVWPGGRPVAVRLAATAPGGGRVSARGQIAIDARAADLKVSMAGVDLAPARAYLPVRASVGGKAGADLDVRATWEPLAITARGAVGLESPTVSADGRLVARAARLEVTGLDYAFPARATIDRLRVEKPWALVERTSHGSLTLGPLTTVIPDGARPAPAQRALAAPALPSPEIRIRRTLIEDAAATVADAALNPPARVEIAGARLSLDNLTWPARRTVRVQVEAPMPGGGKVEVSGQLRPDGTRVDVKVILDRADLTLAAPFLPVKARVAGRVDGDLAVKGSLVPLSATVTGRVGAADATLRDGERTLASAARLDVTGLQADWPRRVVVERVAVQRPWSLVERDADGVLHLFSILGLLAPIATPAAPTGDGRPADPAGAGRGAIVEVGALALEDGFVRFVDRTTRPSFTEEASHLAASARRLGTAPSTRSPITLSGQLTGGARFELDGTVGPLTGPLFLDVRGKLSDLPLSRLSPYAATCFGWTARRGVLDVSVRYHVENDRLEAMNDVVLGQPEIVPSRRGEAVRERIGVPVDTLISLLKDARGEVALSLPVTGNVSSRQFDFGDAVWEGLRKTVINVLALPVSWVGKVFYTEDSRIDTIRIWPVTFEPGTTRVRRDIAAHAERLATFLRDAPGVALTMKPVMTAEDVAALARAAVRQRVEALARQSGEPVATAAGRLFAERFPGRPAPGELDAIVDGLAKDEKLPDGALPALATARVDELRRELTARGGVDSGRLVVGEGAVPVEASGPGRIEFEIKS